MEPRLIWLVRACRAAEKKEVISHGECHEGKGSETKRNKRSGSRADGPFRDEPLGGGAGRQERDCLRSNGKCETEPESREYPRAPALWFPVKPQECEEQTEHAGSVLPELLTGARPDECSEPKGHGDDYGYEAANAGCNNEEEYGHREGGNQARSEFFGRLGPGEQVGMRRFVIDRQIHVVREIKWESEKRRSDWITRDQCSASLESEALVSLFSEEVLPKRLQGDRLVPEDRKRKETSRDGVETPIVRYRPPVRDVASEADKKKDGSGS
jgi:hypothetical protein